MCVCASERMSACLRVCVSVLGRAGEERGKEGGKEGDMRNQRHTQNTHIREKYEGVADSRAVNAPANAVSPEQRERVRIHFAWYRFMVSERDCRLIHLCGRTSERASARALLRLRNIL